MSWPFFRDQKQGKKKKQPRRRRTAVGRRRPYFESLETRELLAVLTVNSALDNTTPGDGFVTLREAILAANSDTTTDLGHTGNGADTIQFDPSLAGMTITLGGTEIVIEESLSINPTNAVQITIDAASNSRIFFITDTASNVSLRGLTLRNGDAGAGNNGGAIMSLGLGTLSISDSTITGSTGANGGAIFTVGDVVANTTTLGGAGAGLGNTADGSGGAIYSEGNVTFRNGTIIGNTATNDGGGIAADSLTVENSRIGGLGIGEGNEALGDGGGLFAGTLSITNSTVSGNTATNGGGLNAVTLTVQASTINNNTADGGNGGGMYGFNVTVRNSTIAGNESTLGDGGGIAGSRLTLQNVTVVDNTAFDDGGGLFASSRVTIHNSILIGNTAADFSDLRVPATRTVRFSLIGFNEDLPADAQFTVTGTGVPNAQGNLVGDGAASAITLVDVFGVGGGTLADNGGPTQTIALGAASIAIDRGSNNLANPVGNSDQRGQPFSRISPFAGNVDMGAFEVQTATVGNNAPVLATPISDRNAQVGNFFNLTIPANTFTDADGDTLIYSATLVGGGALPAWLAFDPVSRTFSGTPGPGDVGAVNVRITANDGHGGSASDDFVISVITDPPPVLSNPIPDRSATVNVPFTFTFDSNTFTDPNGDPLTYSATLTGGAPLPAWLTFNPATRTFSGTPGPGDVANLSVTVTATDPQAGFVSDDFAINVTASELPFTTDFEGPLDARIQQKVGQIELTTTNPISGSQSLRATRLAVGSRPLATVDFNDPTVTSSITNVSVNVATETGNGSSLWSNALVTFDYQSPTNYKFAGVFEIIDRLIIGQVVNGQVTYLAMRAFPAAPNTTIPLNVSIDQTTRQVTLTSGSTTVQHTFRTLGTGTVGVGTINANARFDSLVIS